MYGQLAPINELAIILPTNVTMILLNFIQANNNASETIDLISKIDAFYNSAWEKLIIIGTLSFAVVGIIVPLIIQWYQKKSLKISEELLKKDFEEQAESIKSEILESFQHVIDKKIEEFESRIARMNASNTAKTFHLQANNETDNAKALGDYLFAAKNYLICDEFSNLQVILSYILSGIMPVLSQEEVNDLPITHNVDLAKLLNEIEIKDNNGALTILIRQIRHKLTKLPKTIQDKNK